MVVVEEDGIICADESIIFWKNALCPTDMLNIDCPVGMLLLLNTGTSLCTVTGATATCCMEEEELLLNGVATVPFMTPILPMLDMARFVTLDMGNVEAGLVYIRNNSCMCSFCMCFVISVRFAQRLPQRRHIAWNDICC